MLDNPIFVINPALMADGPQTEVDAGAALLIPSQNDPAYLVEKDEVNGRPALRMNAASGHNYSGYPDGTITLNDHTVFVAVSTWVDPDSSYPFAINAGSAFAVRYDQGGGVWFDLAGTSHNLNLGAPKAGPYSWVAVADGTTVTLIQDGVVVSTRSQGGGGRDLYSLDFSSALGNELYFAGIWDTELSVEDAQQLSLDLLAGGAGSVDVSAHGALSVTGAAALFVDDPLETPDPPAPSSTGGAQSPPPVPEPQLPPDGAPDPVVERLSERMPAPVLDSKGMPIDWSPSSVVQERVGRFQVVVEGTDITYWNGAPTASPEWTDLEPFGPGSARIPMPQVTAFHSPGSGSMGWCKAGANVTIRIKPISGSAVTLFTGVLVSFGHDETPDSNTFTLTCVGDLFVGDMQLRKPAFSTDPRDIGTVLKQELDSVVSRRYSRLPKKIIGATTSVLGGWEPKLTGLAQQLLSTAISKGRQWTISCQNRQPVLVRKNTSTAHWTISNGQRGTQVKLSRDWTQAHNVIYGEGIAPDGGRWRNSKYPNWRPDDTPRYPFNNPDRTIKLGARDGDTDTGDGVSVWQRRAGRPVTGRFSSADVAALRSIQRDAGIQVDNSLGPQSWAATFATGSNTGTLDGAWIAPIASAKQVEPKLYASDGAILGDNPSYDPRALRVERYINFGEGVTKTEGVRAAREITARDSDPGWVGTIKLVADPEEGSRFLIRAGENIRVRHWRGGGTILLHIAAVSHSQAETELTVDTNARDYPTLDAIRNRERQAVDPALAYMKPRGQSRVPRDMPVFDAEAGGGDIPRFALFRNLWSVIRIPVAAYGRIVRTEFLTDSPASGFSVAVFDRPITAAKLLAIVGNPFNADENPWQNHADALDKAGLIMAWGWDKQRLGYYPRDYSTPDRDGGVPVTGRYLDDGSWDFASTRSPWLWVAAISPNSTYIRGRFLQGV